MKFESKYEPGQLVEFVTNNKVKEGKITGVLFGEGRSVLYEINEEEFLEESRVTAIFVRKEIKEDTQLYFDDAILSGAV